MRRCNFCGTNHEATQHHVGGKNFIARGHEIASIFVERIENSHEFTAARRVPLWNRVYSPPAEITCATETWREKSRRLRYCTGRPASYICSMSACLSARFRIRISSISPRQWRYSLMPNFSELAPIMTA